MIQGGASWLGCLAGQELTRSGEAEAAAQSALCSAPCTPPPGERDGHGGLAPFESAALLSPRDVYVGGAPSGP